MLPGLNAVIDLSHHNGNPDFKKIAADGIVGVIHKATQGTKNVDPTYAARRKPALDAGLLWGAYHFGTGSDGLMQAEHFLDVVKPDASTLLKQTALRAPTEGRYWSWACDGWEDEYHCDG